MPWFIGIPTPFIFSIFLCSFLPIIIIIIIIIKDYKVYYLRFAWKFCGIWNSSQNQCFTLFWPCGILMDTELISWMHQYNLMRTFPHIWKIKKIRKWKELNTICSGCETSSIYTWHSCLYAICQDYPFGFLLDKKEGKSWSPFVWLSNCNMVCVFIIICGNQFWELWSNSFHI